MRVDWVDTYLAQHDRYSRGRSRDQLGYFLADAGHDGRAIGGQFFRSEDVSLNSHGWSGLQGDAGSPRFEVHDDLGEIGRAGALPGIHGADPANRMRRKRASLELHAITIVRQANTTPPGP
ncbi:hypothetical protein [Streptomyces sp. bgisy091]|uniref:hypothetical protein n=1 Tax=Streptomyces sp. bgisy091 TaxID=3413778 RepID=UPI003D742711